MSSLLKSKRRDKLYIMAEILEIARNGTLKTQIMYKANLSYAQLTEYVKFMICHNLLKKNRQGGKNIFRSTEKGLEKTFSGQLKKVWNLFGDTTK